MADVVCLAGGVNPEAITRIWLVGRSHANNQAGHFTKVGPPLGVPGS